MNVNVYSKSFVYLHCQKGVKPIKAGSKGSAFLIKSDIMRVDVKVLDNGVRTAENSNEETLHECIYCGTWFKPNRRFIQKYCTESCRVLACRKRKTGLMGTAGGNMYDRNNVTNQTLVNEINELKDKIREFESKHKDRHHDMHLDMMKQTNKIHRWQQWQMLVSVLLPFLKGGIETKFKEIFQSGKPPLNFKDFESQFDEKIKDIPPALAKKIKQSAKGFYKGETDFSAFM